MAIAVVKTERFKVTKFLQKFTFPAEISFVVLKNTGFQDVNIWFDNEKIGDSYPLQRGEVLPAIKVRENVIYFCVNADEGRFNAIMWE